MFLESKYEPQDEYYRITLIIRPNEKLLSFIESIIDVDDDINDFELSTVITTEEARLEGLRPIIHSKTKEAYLRVNVEEFPLCEMSIDESVFELKESIETFFDKWFIMEEVGDFRILRMSFIEG